MSARWSLSGAEQTFGGQRRRAEITEIQRGCILNLAVSAVASTTGQEGPSAWACLLAQRQGAA
jgi:hypothetical protein